MHERKRPEPDWAAVRAEAMAEMIGLGFSDEAAAAEARRIEARRRARIDYGFALVDRMRAAQKAVDSAWNRRFDENPELCDETDGAEDALEAMGDVPEQAALDSALDEVQAVIREGRWPRHLHFDAV